MHSLLEMVLAITITGIIFAGAIIPTTQTIAEYQECQADLARATRQELARVRPEQIIERTWRDLAPPVGYGALSRAYAGELTVGQSGLRATGEQVEQNEAGGDWTPIAAAVRDFSFGYLGKDGVWTTAVASENLDDVVAVRFSWSDAESGRTYIGFALPPDRCHSGGRIELSPPNTPQPYQREDYTRKFSISLGEWQ